MVPRLLSRTLAMLNPGCELDIVAMGANGGEIKGTFFSGLEFNFGESVGNY